MTGSGRFLASARIISVLTLLSRVFGVVREGVLSFYFSTSELLSAFSVGFMAANLARRLFGEGALTSAMVPTLTQSLHERGEESSRRFVGGLLAVLTLTLGGLVLVVEIVLAVWRAYHDDLALKLAAMMLPYTVMICLVAVASGVLNVRRHFAVPAATPILLSVGVILSAVGGAAWAGLGGESLMNVVCIGVLVSGVAQMLLCAMALWRVGFFPRFNGPWRDPQIRYVARLLGPMILGLSAVQINSLVDYVIAYLFVVHDGERVGPAVLRYAQYLYQLPLGVFGIAVATAIFPLLSRHVSAGNFTAFADDLRRGIRQNLFVAFPAAVGLIFVAEPLVAALYQRGAFGSEDTRRVAATLGMYCLGMPAYFTLHMLARAYYSLHEAKTPARTSSYMVGLNLMLNLILVFVLEERGLALSTSLCAWIQVIWLGAKLAQRIPELRWRPMARGTAKIAAATSIMALVLWAAASPALGGHWIGPDVFVRLGVLVVLGTAAYLLAAFVLHMEEWRILWETRRSISMEQVD